MRSSLLRGCVLVLLLILPRIGQAEPKRPNVLFIAIDDLNDWVGCLKGHPQAQTPHIDALAKRGTLFANAHCQAPLCNPSRTSLLTGLRPSTTGIYGLAPWFRTDPRWKDVVSLPQYFHAHGYETLSAGKIWHGGYPPRPEREQEFDVWGPPSSIGVKPPQAHSPHARRQSSADGLGSFPHEDKDKGDYHVATFGVNQLKAKHEKPFFLACGFFLPHVPCYATQKWFDLYPDETLQMPPMLAGDRVDTPDFSWYLHWQLPEPRLSWLKESHTWRPLVQSYLACTSFVDDQVGRLIQALDESGHADDTIVVLWGDHGFHLGEKEISGKNTLWERSTHVPLIFAGPGVTAGAVCRQPAELLDIYPTLVDLCGLPKKDGLEGHSLQPQVQDATTEREWPAITTHNPDNHTVRTTRWRYIRYADGSEELYDMQADPNEWKNLADDPNLATVKADLAKWLPKTSSPPAPGSAHRVLVREGNQWYWEGKPIIDDERVE